VTEFNQRLPVVVVARHLEMESYREAAGNAGRSWLVAPIKWAGKDSEARAGTKRRFGLPQEHITVNPKQANSTFRILQEKADQRSAARRQVGDSSAGEKRQTADHVGPRQWQEDACR